MTHYKFIKDNPTTFEYNPTSQIFSFYQICQFRDPYTNKYGIRKVIFDQTGDIVKTFEKGYSKSHVNSFISHNKPNKYALYPVNNLKMINLPNSENILSAKSELLND